LTQFRKNDYQVVFSRSEMNICDSSRPILGIFEEDALPYDIDRRNNAVWKDKVPTLAEMTSKAIEVMRSHPDGFCLQVEAGKVDWAAHANDVGALLYDQLAFDEAVKVAMDFAEKDGNTLVIITTDHGNSNPGIMYGKNADKNFDSILGLKQSNHYLFHQTPRDETSANLRARIKEWQGWELSAEDVEALLKKFNDHSEDGTYNEYKLPYEIGRAHV